MAAPRITIAIPSFNQAAYLDAALESVISQDLPVEVFVMDGGSSDGSIDVIRKWEPHLSGWRSHRDGGQAQAINEGISRGTAGYVAWLNSDDLYATGGLKALVKALDQAPQAPAAYGRTGDLHQRTGVTTPVWTEPFSERRLALRCIISQPGTLMRRQAWETVKGLNAELHMAMDYDLWWRLYRSQGPLVYVDHLVAINRDHEGTKTNTQRSRHYREAMEVVRQHYGKVPIKWWLAQPYSVWFKSLRHRQI